MFTVDTRLTEVARMMAILFIQRPSTLTPPPPPLPTGDHKNWGVERMNVVMTTTIWGVSDNRDQWSNDG